MARSSHDRLHFYRKTDLPAHAHVAAVDIDDPYAQAGRQREDGSIDVEARLEHFRHRDGSTARGAPGWTPPPTPRITVIQSLKNDPLGHMRARRQIDKAQYLAGRDYQTLYGLAYLGAIGTIDPGRAHSAITAGRSGISDEQRRAATILRGVDQTVIKLLGVNALDLARDVLTEGLSIDRAVRQRSEKIARSEVEHWGWLFRRALDVLAFKLGYASSPHKRKFQPRKRRKRWPRKPTT